ncbi:MAG TPA: hypothetical protein P5104_02660 [Bacteroidales bacterium]|nr:hypothetical protein [Bacteroidales bacterium]
MRKVKILLLIVPVVIFMSCAGKKDKSDNEGKPQVEIPAGNPQGTGQGIINTEKKPGFSNKFERGKKKRESIRDKFDQFGNLIERTENDYDQYGNVSHKNRYTYRYDDRQRLVEQWFYQYTPDDRPVYSNVNYIKYNDRDLKIENVFIGYDQNGNEINYAKNVYKHDALDNVIEDVTYNKDGMATYRINYTWKNKILMGETFVYYDEDGNVKETKSLQYNEQGKVIKK